MELGQWVADLPPHPAEVLPTLQVQGQSPVVRCRLPGFFSCTESIDTAYVFSDHLSFHFTKGLC